MATYRTLAQRLADLGMLTADAASDGLAEVAEWADVDTDLPASAVHDTLHTLGAAVHVHVEDVSDLEESYEEILDAAARLSGGVVTVDDVELIEDDDEGEMLTFTVNGEPMRWTVEHIDEEYLDTLAIVTGLNDVAPDDSRWFYKVNPDDSMDEYYVLVSPEQLDALATEFGMTFDRAG